MRACVFYNLNKQSIMSEYSNNFFPKSHFDPLLRIYGSIHCSATSIVKKVAEIEYQTFRAWNLSFKFKKHISFVYIYVFSQVKIGHLFREKKAEIMSDCQKKKPYPTNKKKKQQRKTNTTTPPPKTPHFYCIFLI